jgi:hypothetical protein
LLTTGLLKRLIPFLIFASILSGCHATAKKTTDYSCSRYSPVTVNFEIALLDAMSEKAFAAYQLKYSDLLTLQMLKDDYYLLFEDNESGKYMNSRLDQGASCTLARISAYEYRQELEPRFRQNALLAMKMGYRKSVERSLTKEQALLIIDKRPLASIKEADANMIETTKAMRKIEKELKNQTQ